jgi:hypothetical protein
MNEYNKRVLNLEKNLEWLGKCLFEIQLKCKHKKETYIPDASGNNDSYYECQTCGLIYKNEQDKRRTIEWLKRAIKHTKKD